MSLVKKRGCLYGFGGLALILVVGVLYVFFTVQQRSVRIRRIGEFFADPSTKADWQVTGGERCGDAPMLIPSTGYLGVGYGDGLPPLYEHTGYDIFSPAGADNITPIYSAYDGYLTREADWLSTVIIRHPDFENLSDYADLPDGEQIWTYYTHMASADGSVSFVEPDFPAGTYEVFIPAGTLLGYQGTWSGRQGDPVGLHLHFSIPVSTASGGYTNETRIENTLDPLPFLGLTENEDGFILCES